MNLGQLVLLQLTYQDKEGVDKYTIGTGYYVSSNLILTSHHLLPSEPIQEVGVRIEINGEWIKADVKPVWQSPTLDAALFRTQYTINNFTLEWQESPFDGTKDWESAGYPYAASKTAGDDIAYGSKGLGGKLYGGGGGGQVKIRLLDLTVDARPDNPENWEGISGAPVLVDGKLAGIIKNVPRNFSGRLEGVPSYELLKDAGFIAALESQAYTIPETDIWAVILMAEGTNEETLCEPTEAALREIFKDETIPVMRIRVTEVLANPGILLRFVKLLCKAPILFMDATEYQPGIMLLLGIRGVVRRSVTIVVTNTILDPSVLSDLPFNIQEIKLICLDDSSAKGGMLVKDRLKAAILEGRAQSKINPHYLDLPPYEAVRNPVVFDIPAIREKALILCSFKSDYRDHFDLVKAKVGIRVETPNILRMLDINSPQLVGQSLHEHIRWARRCVIDWTFWQPNVFYELGVRLATSSIEPFNLLEEGQWQQESTGSPALIQKQLLFALFKPNTYDFAKKSFPLEKMRIHFEYALGKNSLAFSELDPSRVQPGNIYQTAEKGYDWSQDNITIPPHLSIKSRIEREFGKDSQAAGGYNVLYSSNAGFKGAVQNQIRELWLCAWYYLTNRYSMEELKANKEKGDELRSLANSLLEILDVETNGKLMKEILQIKKQL